MAVSWEQGRRREHGQEGTGAGPPAQSNRMKSSTPMSVCRRMARKVPRSSSRCAGTTVCANGLSRLIMIWLPCCRRTRKPNLSSAATTCCPETRGKGSTRRLEFELGAGFEGSCGFALVLALSQMREHGLGPFGRADLHPRRNPLDRQGRFAPQPGGILNAVEIMTLLLTPLGLAVRGMSRDLPLFYRH